MHAGRRSQRWADTADAKLRDAVGVLGEDAQQVAVFDLDGLLVGLSDPGPAYGAGAVGQQDAEALVDAADQALYRAKASGRDTVSW